jgi:hypothetical protein
MSFLNLRKKKTEESMPVKKLVAVDALAKKPAGKLAVASGNTSAVTGTFRPDVVRRPHITEKASASAERGVYVFEVATDANKRDIARAVSLMY